MKILPARLALFVLPLFLWSGCASPLAPKQGLENPIFKGSSREPVVSAAGVSFIPTGTPVQIDLELEQAVEEAAGTTLKIFVGKIDNYGSVTGNGSNLHLAAAPEVKIQGSNELKLKPGANKASFIIKVDKGTLPGETLIAIVYDEATSGATYFGIEPFIVQGRAPHHHSGEKSNSPIKIKLK